MEGVGHGQAEHCADPCSDGCCDLLNLISEQIGLFEMGHSDIMAPPADSFLAAIANILEHGHPAGEQNAT